MKNKSIKTSLFILVIFLSLGSYTYLNSISIPGPNSEIDNEKLKEIPSNTESSLPEVKIVEKAVGFIKNILPTSY